MAFAAAFMLAMAVVLGATKPRGYWLTWPKRIDILASGAGRDLVLPRDALDAIELIRTHGLRQIRFGAGVARRALIRQRIVEGGYPVQTDPAAPDVIDYRRANGGATGGATGDDACRDVATRGRMVYRRCRD